MKTDLRFLLFLFYFLSGFYFYSQNIQNDKDSFTPQEIWQAGLPFIDNYTPDDYLASPNNWSIVESKDGLIYVGNGHGVLEFDGNSWRTILLDNKSIAWSLAKSDNGTIFVGGVNEFGYLKKDNLGFTKYYSLVNNLEEKDKKFGHVWSATSIGRTIFFSGDDFLFRWKDGKIKVWKPKTRFGDVFVLHNELYVISEGVGVLQLKNEVLKPIPNNDYVLNFQRRVSILEPLEDNKMLVGIPFGGLFVYDGNVFTKLNYQIQELVSNNHIRYSSQISNQVYAVGTLKNGLYFVDVKDNSISRKFGKNEGLLSDGVNFIYKASDGALWIASDRGVSRMNTSLPIRKFNDLAGLSERVRSTVYNGHSLFVASNGVFKLTSGRSNSNFEGPRLKKIDGIEETIRHIIPVKSHKLVVGNSNLYDLDENNNASLITKAPSGLYSYAVNSKLNSNKVYVTSVGGALYEYILNDRNWVKKLIAKINEEIVLVTEDENGDLWLSTYYDGIYKLKYGGLSKKKDSQNFKTHFDTISGLPSMEFNAAFRLNKDIYVVNADVGLFKFSRNSRTFTLDSIIMKQYPEEVSQFNTTLSDLKGNNWQPLVTGSEYRIYNLNNSIVKELPESKIFGKFNTMDVSIMGDIVLFSGPEGIIAYNQAIRKPNANLPPIQIRKVFSKNDSLIYAGKGGVMAKEFEYDINFLDFEYSLPYYSKSDKNSYQYQLVGFDEEWSSWSFDTKKYYTNLPEGDYTFKVRAKNIFGEISEEDSYRFTILPPWYRTWWAYTLYGLGAILTLTLFSQWRSKQLKAKNLALEKVVDQRTLEIKEKNLLLENQTEKLKELDTMKTRLFANISHEFRTPLTLIKGPVEKMEEAGETKLSMTNVKMIRRNANRLLNLVNQLLDLSKLDSGKLELNEAEGDLFKCLRAAASSFSSHAAQRDIDYQVTIPARGLWTSFDRDKIEKIVYNLLSNAFKFTADSGKIGVDVNYRGQRLQLIVSDNGQGIKVDKLPHIFDRFFQVDNSYTKEKAGSGIGLALTKELVDLMQGEIYVESEFEKGSVFKVVLEVVEIRSHAKIDSEEYQVVQQEVLETEAPLVQTEKNADQILIIEDNNDMRHFIREQLQQDYEILEAPNGKEGLKMAMDKMPDLIITDLMMPQMDGVTLTKKLKTQIHTSHIPVVMLTAKAGIENKLEGLETGADDYLTKPFNAKELKVRVKNLVEERKKLRELFSKKTTLNPAEVTVTSMDEQFLEKVLQLLEDQHHDSEFGVPEMQTALGMSKTQLHRKLKALTDQPPGELLRNFRLKRAAQLLLQKGENVSQIAYSVGFNGLSYFTKCFKELYGVAPSEYAEKGNYNS